MNRLRTPVVTPVVLSVVLVATLLVLTGCTDAEELLEGLGSRASEALSAAPSPAPAAPSDALPDEYADFLAMRQASRASAALLVRGLADALGGTVGTIDGDWEGCGQRGEETYAYTYVVQGAVDDTGTGDRRRTVERVLGNQGWATSTPRVPTFSERVEASRDGLTVSVVEGIPAEDLMIQTAGGCFAVPEQHRADVEGDLGDARIVVPPR